MCIRDRLHPGADSDYRNVRTCEPLKNFVSEKSGKRCEKSGKYWTKSGNREILRRFISFLYPHLTPVFKKGDTETRCEQLPIITITIKVDDRSK